MTRPLITTDPAVRFGKPAIKGISVDAIAGTVWAGEDLDTIADDYRLTRPEILVACWHEGAEQPMSDELAGICGNTIAGLMGDPLVCDRPAGHVGWHSCEQSYTAAPQASATLTSTVSRCHWARPSELQPEAIAAAEQRGYDKAVANLLDTERFVTWAFQHRPPTALMADVCAEYLEAVRDQP